MPFLKEWNVTAFSLLYDIHSFVWKPLPFCFISYIIIPKILKLFFCMCQTLLNDDIHAQHAKELAVKLSCVYIYPVCLNPICQTEQCCYKKWPESMWKICMSGWDIPVTWHVKAVFSPLASFCILPCEILYRLWTKIFHNLNGYWESGGG